ncbi:extensin family protein [Erythrobacter sp.]|uniref:extensin-like domain-containing protein n=1 Tax=Erythrobacter sp. TaxID=1042 RepID=UPI003C778AF2
MTRRGRSTLPRTVLISLLALAVGGCGSLLPGAGDGNRAATNAPDRSRATPRAEAQAAARPGDAACFAELGRAGATFEPLPDAYEGPGCNRLGTVRLSQLTGDVAPVSIANSGPVRCALARTFSDWARFGVDRAARQMLGSGLSRVETMGSYSCRNIAGSNRRSAHAEAAAIDVSGFVLEDGRRITLAGDWDGGSREEREFLRTVHRSACKRFGTVLGPDYNSAHEDHFHLEESGGGFCR